MLSFLPGPVKGILATSLFILNTVFWCLLIYVFAIPKLLIPHVGVRRWCSEIMAGIAQNWISFNSHGMSLLHRIEWDISGTENLRSDRSYLVWANHQSWVDIVILQHVFNRRIPFLRFFLKRELIRVPVLGLAWWALDFPFMNRHSAAYLAKHPEKRGADLEVTRRACERFRGQKISVLNFLEGTRFTPAKREAQKSPYQNLLRPKTGGIAFVLEAMGDQFHSVLDVTIVYPDSVVTFGQLLMGRLHRVKVIVHELEIPKAYTGKSSLDDAGSRGKLKNWIQEIWLQKDAEIELSSK